jgi:beta-lactamase class A
MKKFPFIQLIMVFSLVCSCKPGAKTAKTNLPKTPVNDSAMAMNPANTRTDVFLTNLLKSKPEFFDSVLANKDQNRLQIIYTKIDRGRNSIAKLTDYYYNVNADNYFYPASTVKFPAAVLAMQKLNELKIAGLDLNTTMITESAGEKLTPVFNDPTSPDGRPTIAQYIKKIFLVSDNDAFNRLYEFLGQEYINEALHKMGYTKTQLLHRLSIALNEDENRTTNPIRFLDANNKLVYEKPLQKSAIVYAERNTKLGKGYMSGEKLVNEPFDFSKKNRLVLEDLHAMLKSIYFSKSVSAKQRFNLTDVDYSFLHKYMSMLPQQSTYPAYDTANYWPAYVKFLFYGSEKGELIPDIHIYNKVGDAYGFLIDVAYIVDTKNNIEFMLSAAMHCNSDGIFNDDKYDYDTVGFPFMKNLGRLIYDYELKRERKFKPELSGLLK